MSACERCWEDASRDALLLGGSVVEHYDGVGHFNETQARVDGECA